MPAVCGTVLTPRGRLGASLVNAAVLAGVERFERVDTLGTVLAASERTGEESRGVKTQTSDLHHRKWGCAHQGKHLHEPQTEIVGGFGNQGDAGATEG